MFLFQTVASAESSENNTAYFTVVSNRSFTEYPMDKEVTNVGAGETFFATMCVVCCFVICKSSYDYVRKWRGKIDIYIIGSGPVVLTAALIAAQSRKAAKIVLFEERTRAQIMGRSHQILLDKRSVSFMRKLGFDFDNIEGCWDQERFYTRIGIFQDYLLSILQQRTDPVIEMRLGTKFSEEIANTIHGAPKQTSVVVAADGLRGISSNILGLSDEFIVEPCNVYGAFSAFERSNQPQVPTPEIRIRKLKLDLSAFGSEFRIPELNRSSFHLKIFGTFRHRYMSLLCHKCESNVVRQLRITNDQVIMRNIFQESFNNYRCKGESRMTDMEALSMRCNGRLTEIKLAYRRECVAFVEDENMVVLVEGDAARNLNQSLGFELNLGLRGLESFEKFLQHLIAANEKRDILKALAFKARHAQKINDDIVKNRLVQEISSQKKPNGKCQKK